ncbi:MAG TPA: hypothetical protein VHT91_11950 [Kofleriaceae bacterium]|nr:hypothetical protein [Kofleriaceae bacterium]
MQTTDASLARAIRLAAACVAGALVAGCSAPSHPDMTVPPIPDGPGGPGGPGGTSGDGGLDGGTSGSCTPAPGQTAGTPGLGAHTLAFYGVGDDTNLAPLFSPAMTTQSSGSTIVLGIGRGNKALFAAPPVDNKNNLSYPRCGAAQQYPLSTDSATAVYALPAATGGAGFQVKALNGMNTGGNTDEITMFTVEIAASVGVTDVQWLATTSAAQPATTRSVTTTGPATLISFWWGDSTAVNSVATDNGFTVIDQQLLAQKNVQGAVAVKSVAAAGTYSVTWTVDPAQPAQLWLVAAQ